MVKVKEAYSSLWPTLRSRTGKEQNRTEQCYSNKWYYYHCTFKRFNRFAKVLITTMI